MKRYAFDPRVPYDPTGGWSRELCDPGCCWRDEDAECPVEHDSEQHIYIKNAQYAKYVKYAVLTYYAYNTYFTYL
jgi:hypothetical protein